MNILIVTPGFPSQKGTNASAKFVFNEALAYSINGANVHVLTPHYPGAMRQEKINEKLYVKRFRYFFPEKYQLIVDPILNTYDKKNALKYIQVPLFFFSFIFNVLKYSIKADVIHCQWTTSVLVALPAKWLFGKKIVVTARGSDIRLMPKWLNKFIFKKVDAAIDCYGPQPWNNNIKKTFHSNYIKLPLIVNPLKTNAEKLEGFDDIKQIRIIYLGRFDYLKIDDTELPLFELVDAAAKLINIGLNIKVAYIGDGDKKIFKKLVDKIKFYDIEDHIKLLGFQVEPEKYFNNFDLGIGGIAFNTVCQEYVFSGIPQILVDNKHNKETPWTHNVNCFFTKPFSVDDLIDNIKYCYYNKDSLEKIALNAKKLLDDFLKTPEEGGEIYINKFKRLI